MYCVMQSYCDVAKRDFIFFPLHLPNHTLYRPLALSTTLLTEKSDAVIILVHKTFNFLFCKIY